MIKGSFSFNSKRTMRMRGHPKIILRNSQLKAESHLKVIWARPKCESSLFYNSHLSWSYFQGGNYSNFPFSRAFPRDIFVYNPILWVSHSRRLISWQSSRSILLWTLWRLTRGHGVITSHHVSHSWLWSGFNHPSDSADDTLTAPVKWKFNKISQQKK